MRNADVRLKNVLALTAVAIATLLAGCQTTGETGSRLIGRAVLERGDGADAGMARLYSSGGEITMSVALDGFAAGTKAVRLRDIGACDASVWQMADSFDERSRKTRESDPAAGGFENLTDVSVGENGIGMMGASFGAQSTQILRRIFDRDGASIVVHGAAQTIAGEAGRSKEEIACGVLRPDR